MLDKDKYVYSLRGVYMITLPITMPVRATEAPSPLHAATPLRAMTCAQTRSRSHSGALVAAAATAISWMGLGRLQQVLLMNVRASEYRASKMLAHKPTLGFTWADATLSGANGIAPHQPRSWPTSAQDPAHICPGPALDDAPARIALMSRCGHARSSLRHSRRLRARGALQRGSCEGQSARETASLRVAFSAPIAGVLQLACCVLHRARCASCARVQAR